ncbi:hypothetical protein HPB47_022432 [Ixodes persulcatus]|uniref:Uncharacterized protein n=1 Tax=Ixodes persulcatus TaxID=34615 RepID=A0AC60Q9R4_IXOPE|nr:hypothetical protein HPB47_022432 [Ixodes persulcatus]
MLVVRRSGCYLAAGDIQEGPVERQGWDGLMGDDAESSPSVGKCKSGAEAPCGLEVRRRRHGISALRFRPMISTAAKLGGGQ